MTTYTPAQVAAHNRADDCWISVEGKVYDVTEFMKEHPGGKKLLLSVAGQDASNQFRSFHGAHVLSQHEHLCVGTLKSRTTERTADPMDRFGSTVPFGEPYWYQKHLQSPYYKPTHAEFRARVRAFVDKELIPYVHEWDEAGAFPPELHEKAYAAGIYGAIWPEQYGGTPPAEFDAFHDLILIDELSRCAAGGVLWSCFFSFGIALPPVLKVGSPYLKEKVAGPVIRGQKIMCLAVTEPFVGSDVANLKTTARREGDYYIVNGAKKFITGGMKADYFTTAVRTGGEGMRGISLLLLEKGMPGISVRRMKTQGWWISNTAYVTFEDVKVPVKNLIGEENKGFYSIMSNFNHERFVLAAMSNRYARVCLEESIKYGRVRKTFDKRLLDHQALRHKVAEMGRLVESTHALLEQIAYQMSEGVDDRKLAGIIALAKVQATKTMEFCTREASQIFGGNAYVRGGPGEKVERLYRETRVNAIGGGSEEVLLDLAMRQAKL